jgi:hypothetical protein
MVRAALRTVCCRQTAARTPALRGQLRRYSAAGLGSPEGWHRFCACDATGTEARFRVFEGDDEAARQFVVSANLMRRHLDTGERAMVAGKFANMPHGTNQHTTGGGANLPILKAATLFNVSERSVKDARTVLASRDAETIAAVDSGKVSVSRAAKQVRASTPKPGRLDTPSTPESSTALPAGPPQPSCNSSALVQWAQPRADVHRIGVGTLLH